MTLLSENLRTLRKHLDCTQMAIAQVLDIGFRTYVRYEAAERDAPVGVLIKLAKLGNISLDRLLSTPLTEKDLALHDAAAPPAKPAHMEVIGGGVNEGRLTFKGLKGDFLVATLPLEKRLLSGYRRMNRKTQNQWIEDLDWAAKNAMLVRDPKMPKKIPKKIFKAKNTARLQKMAKAIPKTTARG